LRTQVFSARTGASLRFQADLKVGLYGLLEADLKVGLYGGSASTT